MASVSKLSRDRKKKSAPYYIQFFDHTGCRRTTKGCPDKGVTETKAAQIETLVERIKLGLAAPADLDRALGQETGTSLKDHVRSFEVSLRRKNNTPNHVRLTLTRVRTIIKGCGFRGLGELSADAVEAFRSDHCEQEGLGHRTYNHYLQAIDSFGNWLAHPKRRILPANPVAGIPRRNAATDVRYPRRALTHEEFALLVKTAARSTIPFSATREKCGPTSTSSRT
ncbi:MAG: hypothetical protein AB7U20_21045 [Planctomycetaceae bacterium]